MEKLTVIKVGGKVVESEESLNLLLENFAAIEGNKVLVHGGGRSATALAEKIGIKSQMIDGRRVTDSETLKVVTMVYAGLVNKGIVAGLQAKGVNAIGLTGADFDSIRAVKRPVVTVDYGYVGDVTAVNGDKLSKLIDEGAVPVMAPLTHDGEGSMLNTNADTIASAVACELSKYYETHLIYSFEKRGVLKDENDDDSVISKIESSDFASLQADGTISGGMIPKLQNGFDAINQGVKSVTITLATEISNSKEGTTLLP